MKVLNSSKAFRERYAKRVTNVFNVAAAVGAGGAATGGMVSASAAAASTAAINASAWSAFTGWPLIGGIAAGKAAAAGSAAAVAAATSAAVLLPAIAVGGGIAAGVIYWNRKRKTLHKGSGVETLADAFARVACLPMMALAVLVCKSNPSNTEGVRNYVLKELGAWGYAESYVRAGFDEAMRHSAADLDGQYHWAMGKLESGSTEGIGATPAELPVEAVRGFADEFRNNLEKCIEQ